VTWRDRARTAAYQAYDYATDGAGLRLKATVAAQVIATADNHHPGASAIAAGLAIAAMVADKFVTVPDPDVRYAGFDTGRK